MSLKPEGITYIISETNMKHFMFYTLKSYRAKHSEELGIMMR